MKKSDLIETIAKEINLSKNQVNVCVNMLLAEITKALKKGQDVILTGFGTFSVTKRNARVGINPKTGEKINIPTAKALKFKAGKTLKDAVKKS